MEKLLTFAAIGIALVALFRKPAPVVIESGGSNALPSFSLGNGPVINIQSTQRNDPYEGGAYPPLNSCGCGRAATGIRLTNSIAPIYGAASQVLPGTKQPLPVGAAEKVDLIGNGAYV